MAKEPTIIVKEKMYINFNKFDPINGNAKSIVEQVATSRRRSPSHSKMLQKIVNRTKKDKRFDGDGSLQMGGDSREDKLQQMMQQKMGGRGRPIQTGIPKMPLKPSGPPQQQQGQPQPQGQMPSGPPPQQQQQPQEMDLWDSFSGQKQKFIRADDTTPGLRSSRDINGDIMAGYMKAAGELRTSQPSGGVNPDAYNTPYGSGTDPSLVRGMSREETPVSLDYMQLDKIAAKSKEEGQKDPQLATPHQTPGAPVEIPDGMGGVDQQKSLAMKGAQFWGGVPDTPEQEGGPAGGSLMQQMMAGMGGGQPSQGGQPPQGGMPQMPPMGGQPPQGQQPPVDTKPEKPSLEVIQRLKDDPDKLRQFLQKYVSRGK